MTKTTISLNGALKIEHQKNKKTKTPFTERVNEMCDRYDSIIALTPVPEITPEELEIFKEVFPITMSPLTVKDLDKIIYYSMQGEEKHRKSLAEKSKEWSVAEIMKLLEYYDIH